MIMFNAIAFIVLFNIIFSIDKGGFNFRTIYAIKVCKVIGFKYFLKYYILSYWMTYSQLHKSEKFIPEINDIVEKTVSSSEKIVEKHDWLENNVIININDSFSKNGSFRFDVTKSEINGENYLLSPMVFIVINKRIKQIRKEKKSFKELSRCNNI